MVTCGSVWACPVCATAILTKRGQRIAVAIEAQQAQGGSVALLTLTMRHNRTQALAMLWDALSAAWRASQGGQSRHVRAQLAELGYAGSIRRTEVTFGWRNGWHVHLHVLVMLDGTHHASMRAKQLSRVMGKAWAAALVARGLEAPTERRGVDVSLISRRRSAEAAARYVSKGLYETALEVAAATTKGGRRGNRTPFEILRDLVAHEQPADVALWHEWEQTSRGRRSIFWTPKLADRLGLDADQEDEELAAADDVEAETIAIIPAEVWPAVRADAPELLEHVETHPGDPLGALVGWLTERGLPPPLTGQPPSRACARGSRELTGT